MEMSGQRASVERQGLISALRAELAAQVTMRQISAECPLEACSMRGPR